MPEDKLDLAAEEATKKTNTPTEDEEELESTESDESESTEDEEEEESDEEEAARDKAKKAADLYDALNDPTRGKLVLRYLAEQAGLLEGTNTEKKEAIKDWVDELKAELGEEDAHLVAPLAKILNKFVFAREAKIRQEAQQELNAFKVQLAEQRLEENFQNFVEKNSVTNAESEAINKLAKEIQPTQGTSFNKYMTRLLSIVRSEGTKETRKVTKVQKQTDNLQRRLPKGTESSSEQVIRDTSKKIDLDTAVARAMKLVNR